MQQPQQQHHQPMQSPFRQQDGGEPSGSANAFFATPFLSSGSSFMPSGFSQYQQQNQQQHNHMQQPMNGFPPASSFQQQQQQQQQQHSASAAVHSFFPAGCSPFAAAVAAQAPAASAHLPLSFAAAAPAARPPRHQPVARHKRPRDGDDLEALEAELRARAPSAAAAAANDVAAVPSAAAAASHSLDELPPPPKRLHTQSDSSTLLSNHSNRLSSGLLAALPPLHPPFRSNDGSTHSSSDSMAAAASAPAAAAASVSVSSAHDGNRMDDLCSSAANSSVGGDEALPSLSPSSDDGISGTPTPGAAASSLFGSSAHSGSGGGSTPSSPSSLSSVDAELDTDQWRRLQVTEQFKPMLEQLSSAQVKLAGGFDSQGQRSNHMAGRAVWDKLQAYNQAHGSSGNPMADSSLAAPLHQQLVLYKPSRSPAMLCRIEEIDSDESPSPSPSPSSASSAMVTTSSSSSAAARNNAASAAASRPHSSSSHLPMLSSCSSGAVLSIPAGTAHAGWKRRRRCDEDPLPLYATTVRVETLDGSEEQDNKRARTRTPPNANQQPQQPLMHPDAPAEPPAAASAAQPVPAAASSSNAAAPLTPTDQPMSESLPPSPLQSGVPAGSGGTNAMHHPSALSLPGAAASASAAAVAQPLAAPPAQSQLLQQQQQQPHAQSHFQPQQHQSQQQPLFFEQQPLAAAACGFPPQWQPAPGAQSLPHTVSSSHMMW
jgi:hypothetical protein